MAKVLIVGGGVAGLSTGIYALLDGHEVTVCERHKVAGGNLTGWDRGEYHIDNCIHWLTGTNPTTSQYQIWQTLGALGETDVYRAESLYTFELDGKTLSLKRDLLALEEDMLAISPEDKKEIKRFVSAIKCVQGICKIKGAGQEGRVNLLATAARMPTLARYLHMSIGELSRRFTHPLLRGFLRRFIGTTFTALALIAVFATFCGDNGDLPQGGSYQMAERMVARFKSLGGRLLTGKKATGIQVVNGKATAVTFAGGERMEAEYIVCATDLFTAYRLMQKPLPKWANVQLNEGLRFSSVHAAFSCPIAALPFRGEYLLALSKKEQLIFGADTLVVREFSHEPSFAPTGQTVLQTLTFCKEESAKGWVRLRKDKAAYLAKKEEIVEETSRLLVKKFPSLEGKIQLLDVWTPASYERYYGEETGAYMSFILPKGRLPVGKDCRVKGVKNVWIASQWLRAPGGLPTAASMGKRVAKAISRQAQPFRLPMKLPMIKARPSRHAH